MVKYYSLEEAARLLNTTEDELKLMSRRGEVRGFQDRGSLRFRSQEIEELARRRGLMNSDPDLQLAPDQPAQPAHGTPAKEETEGVFNFDLALEDDSDEVELAAEKPPQTASGRKGASPRPSPKPGSDSDVRLVADGSDLDFKIASDSEAKLVEEAPPAPSARRNTRTASPAKDQPDSGVRLIALDEKKSDSDVKIVGEDDQAVDLGGGKKKKTASDSDIRLEETGKQGRQKDVGSLTEEIDLDAEVRRAEEQSRHKKGGSSATHRTVTPNLPTTSPFELSDVDLEAPTRNKPKGRVPGLDSSDDFELTPAAQDLSPLELGTDEEIALQDLDAPRGKKAGDKGISLEQSGSQDELELEVPAPRGSTPRPAKGKPESSGEFELSLEGASPGADKDSNSDFELSHEGGLPAIDNSQSEFELSLEGGGGLKPDSDSEFELSLEGADAPAEQGSDSEFELTLDDSGSRPAAGDSDSGEKDIFETDQFEVPDIDEDSGSEAVAIEEGDTDLETSDFDLALGEDDAAEEEPSGSQVVALEDEEETDDAAATVQRPAARKAVVADDDEAGEFDELDLEEEAAADVDDDELAPALAGTSGAAVAAVKPARWGLFPALVMIPTVAVMILVGIMSWEMLQVLFGNTQGQKTPGLVTPWIAYNLMGLDKPKE